MRGTLLDNIKKAVVTLVACFGLGLGMACMYTGGLGSDPVSMFNQGLARTFGISEGLANILLSLVLFVIMLIWGRKFIYVATVITTFMIGVGCDVFMAMFKALLPNGPSLVVQIILMIFSIGLLGFFIGFYISLDFGSGPVDAMMQIVSDRIHKSYKFSQWITYSIAFVLGLILRGTVGVGTVLLLVCTGTIVDFSSKFFRKYWPMWLKFSDYKPQTVEN